MIEVTIAGTTVSVDRASEGWISRMIADARRSGTEPCVLVSVRATGVELGLSTPACGGGGGGRQANAKETEIIEAWRSRGLATGQLSPGELTSFLSQLRRMV